MLLGWFISFEWIWRSFEIALFFWKYFKNKKLFFQLFANWFILFVHSKGFYSENEFSDCYLHAIHLVCLLSTWLILSCSDNFAISENVQKIKISKLLFFKYFKTDSFLSNIHNSSLLYWIWNSQTAGDLSAVQWTSNVIASVTPSRLRKFASWVAAFHEMRKLLNLPFSLKINHSIPMSSNIFGNSLINRHSPCHMDTSLRHSNDLIMRG